MQAVYEKNWDPAQIMPCAEELAEKSAPGDRVLVDGGDWNPAVLYCADREG